MYLIEMIIQPYKIWEYLVIKENSRTRH